MIYFRLIVSLVVLFIGGTKDFTISCIRLAVWLPKALVEQKVRLSNLRKLIFGRGKRDRMKQNKDTSASTEGSPAEKVASDPPSTSSEPVESEVPITNNRVSLSGHGRLPHSAYTNTTEHTLSLSNFTVGDLCPEHCGGKLYRFELGILVRVKGQNLAAVHKYWIEKLRCASCSNLMSADIPKHVGTEKYDAAFKAILALQKYYVAIPFNRQAYFQALLGVPLPTSTDIVITKAEQIKSHEEKALA